MKFETDNHHEFIEPLRHYVERFRHSLNERPVTCAQANLPNFTLPSSGHALDTIHSFIDEHLLPGISASNGPRYWGFVTGGANPIATYADWLVTVFNQNVSKGGDSIASSIERQAIGWLNALFYLPEQFSGLFTTGATSANLLGALVARQFAGLQQGVDIAKQGMQGLDVQVFSACPHASMIKSLGLAGIGQNNWQQIERIEQSEAMDVEALASALSASSAKSKIVIASAATVTGTDYDDLLAIALLCEQHQAWLHVDAAFGIFERLLNGRDGKTKGLEHADSITLDCHKWLNVPYDCGVFLTRHQPLLKQTCHVAAPYLEQSGEDDDFMSLGIENSRRFRALPVWFTLMFYGKEGVSQAIRSNVSHAQMLARWIDSSPFYELVKPCDLNVVLFKPNTSHPICNVRDCRQVINQSLQVFVTPGFWHGEEIIRAAFSNWSTTRNDVERAISVLAQLCTE